MKKVLFLSLTLPLLFACNKADDSTSFDTPTYAEASAKVVINEPLNLSIGNDEVVLQEINFMRSGRYVIEGIAAPSKSVDEKYYGYGTFTVNGNTYTLSGDVKLTVTVGDKTITVSGNTVSATTTHTEIPAGGTQDNISRTWKLDHVILEFKALGGRARYTSISGIVDDIVAHKIDIDADMKARILEHEIKEITVDAGVICVSFTKAAPFKGTFNIGNGTTFTYSFKGTDMEGDLFEAEASGKVEFKDGKAVISLSVKTGIEDLGSGTAEITLVEVK